MKRVILVMMVSMVLFWLPSLALAQDLRRGEFSQEGRSGGSSTHSKPVAIFSYKGW